MAKNRSQKPEERSQEERMAFRQARMACVNHPGRLAFVLQPVPKCWECAYGAEAIRHRFKCSPKELYSRPGFLVSLFD